MGAAEHQHVHARALQRLEILACDQLGRRMIEPPLFDQPHEQRAGLRVDTRIRPERGDGPLVGPAPDRAADAGVEHAERRRVHGRGTGTLNPTPWGTARTFSSGGKSIRCAETKASAPEKRWLKIHSTSQSCTS